MQIDHTIIYLIGSLTPNSQNKPCIAYLESLLNASPEFKLQAFASAFCMVENALIHFDPESELGRKSLREIVQLKFPLNKNYPFIQAVLIAPSNQRHAICSLFLQLVKHKLTRHFGQEHKPLATFGKRIDSLQAQPLQFDFSTCQQVAMDLFDWAKQKLGTDYLSHIYQDTYLSCMEHISILAESDSLLLLLPTEIMTPKQLALYMQFNRS